MPDFDSKINWRNWGVLPIGVPASDGTLLMNHEILSIASLSFAELSRKILNEILSDVGVSYVNAFRHRNSHEVLSIDLICQGSRRSHVICLVSVDHVRSMTLAQRHHYGLDEYEMKHWSIRYSR